MALDLAIRLSAEGAEQVRGEVDSITGKFDQLRNMWVGMAGLSIAGVGLHELAQMADAATTLHNSLKLVTGSSAEAAAVQRQLFDAAQSSRVSYTDLGATYSSLARAGQEMGVSQSRLLTVTQAIGNAMTISGGSAQGMQAALVQLSQGLASGTLRGEELNSVMEQAPRLSRALADGLGVSIGELRKLGTEGALTAERVMDALERAAPQLAKEISSATLTLGQAFTVLGNSTTNFIGQADDASGATGALARSIQTLAGWVDSLGSLISEHKTAFAIIGTTLAGAAVAAGLWALVPAIGAVTVALGGMALAAAPVTLAIAGIGAAVAGAMAAWNVFANSETALRNKLDSLKSQNDSVYLSGEARKQQIDEIRGKLALLEAKQIDVTAEDARFARQAQDLKTREKNVEQLNGVMAGLYGVNEKTTSTVMLLRDAYERGDLTLQQYRDAVDRATGAHKEKEKALEATRKKQEEHQRALEAATGAYNNQITGIRAKVAELDSEATGSGKLNDAEQTRLKVYSEFGDKYKLWTADQKIGIAQALDEWSAKLKLAEATKAEKKELDELAKASLKQIKHYEDAETAIDTGLKKADDMVLAIQRQTEQLGMSNVEREISNALLDLEKAGLEKGTYAYQVYADKVRQAIVDRDQVRASIDQTKAIGDEWKKFSDDIQRGLTDSLYRAFESGKGFFSTLWNGIVNTFKTTVLKLAVNAVMKPVNTTIGGLLGTAGGSAPAATGGEGLGSLASLAGLGGSLSTFGGAALSGLMSWGSGVGGVSGMLGAGSTLLGAGNFAAGLGAFAGALGPVALGLAALSALQGKPTPHTGSVVGLDSAGLRTLTGDDSTITSNLSQETDTALRTLLAGSAGVLNDVAQAFGLGSSFTGTAKFAADGKDASIGQFILGRDGQILNQVGTGASSLTGGGQFAFYGSDRMAAYQQFAGDVAGVTSQALLALQLPDWAMSELQKLGAGSTLDDITRVAQQIVERKAGMDAPAADSGPAFEPIGRNEMLDELRLLRERVDLVTAEVGKLLASAEAGLAGVADNTGRAARTLEGWSDGDAVLTRAAA